MCLGIPGRVIEVIDPANKIARVDVKGTPRNVSLALLPADETAGRIHAEIATAIVADRNMQPVRQQRIVLVAEHGADIGGVFF